MTELVDEPLPSLRGFPGDYATPGNQTWLAGNSYHVWLIFPIKPPCLVWGRPSQACLTLEGRL